MSGALVVDANICHAIEDPIEGDPTFSPRERRSGTGVIPPPERNVFTNIRTVHAELIGFLELPRVAV
jgi:hypothetical protein